MTEYLPIYQTGVSLTRSLPAMESNYGNQTVELSVLQNTELLEVDLGNLNLSDTALTDMLTFWFVFGSKWFRFGLPEFKLDAITTPKTSKYAYFKLEANNIYKLFLRNNGIDKRIYLVKNLKIANYTGVIKELSDYTFYLSVDPGSRAITGDYDVPVIMENNKLSIGSSKDNKLNNLRVKEILFGEEVTPPIKLTNLVRSVVSGGGAIKSPPPPPPPPFVGGQCPVPYDYIFDQSWQPSTGLSGYINTASFRLQGPISEATLVYINQGGRGLNVYIRYIDANNPVSTLTSLGFTNADFNQTNIRLRRVDGLPDDCGNLPGYQQP
jgi:hypothetical protein